MIKRFTASAVLAITAAATISAADTHGTAADSSRVVDLDEVVVVSLPKEAFRLRQQPLSSSVFTTADMNRTGARDIRSLSGFVPSFAMPEYGSRLTSSMYIRGTGSRVNNPAVGMYVDGIPLVCKSAFNFHSYQTDRVDILRGPQGTLYGMNTEGGLVRVYSKNPLMYRGSEIIGGGGSHGMRHAEVAHYHRPSDKLAFSTAGFYNGGNGFFRNAVTGGRADKYNEAGGKTRLIYMPTHRTTIDFIADYQYVRQNGFPYGTLDTATGDTDSPATNREGNYRRNMLNTGVHVKYSGDSFLLNSTTSYQYLKDYMMMDQDYLPQDFMYLEQRQFQNAVTQEFTLKNNPRDAWHRTTGVYASYQWLRTDAPVYFGNDFTRRISSAIQAQMYTAIVGAMKENMIQSGMPATAAEAAAKAAVERAGGVSVSTRFAVPAMFHTPQLNIGIYHESNIDLGENITATLGLRYDHNNVRLHYDTQAAMGVTANVMGREATNTLTSTLKSKTSNAYNQLLPKVGITYRTDSRGSNIYATVSKGYRAGGFNIQMFSDILQTEITANSQAAMRGDHDVEHTAADYDNVNRTIAYKPEESWNYEAGAHLNLFGNMMHADIAVYYMTIRNQQLSVMAGNYGFGRMMVNAGRSTGCGFEASLRGSAFDERLSWAASYGFTHSIFRDYKDNISAGSGDADVTTVDYRGNKVPFVPAHTLGANTDYRIRTNGSLVKNIIIGASLTACGKIWWDEANTYSQDFYALLGAHIDVATDKVVLSIRANNITGTHYNTFAFDSAASGKRQYFAQRGAPFCLNAELRLKF
ncbi:TonB-dependent receptor [Prevotella sp. PCHR]|uniref:TonB-dependent receptor n=1 Tax=Xylanibacter caecicola TaxID=2736294 RepID=A0ABX2B6C2_9BACT|nr:TonB-dependent receptor [Xylanibacter caecicola]NPE25785.1 TonB-dependent receptor [Xylanibacter caecicola]